MGGHEWALNTTENGIIGQRDIGDFWMWTIRDLSGPRQAVVIGTPHVLQEIEVRRPANADLEKKGKALFKQAMRNSLAAWHCDLLAEEASYKRPYIGRNLAAELGCEYLNMNMTEPEKHQSGILTSDDVISGTCTTEQWEEDQVRKDPFMFDRVMQHAYGKAKILLICGPLHISGLAQRLRAAGFNTLTKDVRSENWYVTGMDSESRN